MRFISFDNHFDSNYDYEGYLEAVERGSIHPDEKQFIVAGHFMWFYRNSATAPDKLWRYDYGTYEFLDVSPEVPYPLTGCPVVIRDKIYMLRPDDFILCLTLPPDGGPLQAEWIFTVLPSNIDLKGRLLGVYEASDRWYIFTNRKVIVLDFEFKLLEQRDAPKYSQCWRWVRLVVRWGRVFLEFRNDAFSKVYEYDLATGDIKLVITWWKEEVTDRFITFKDMIVWSS